ncbi:tyramine oxidase [Rhizobiaceae bacterium n13]|uniref:Amine oxidase n=1 Tax=Ferirhizobium litorale TaxID=2927786 RepID=A0AAE3QEE5_9HYPH|nr:tyramine oxidase [Fererhizobium litorale]MDI7862799.1 tyramine oxidase [Fererhizobium litorale]MDI7924337.1 tyramine oxidase [Fererhizobium litorale]
MISILKPSARRLLATGVVVLASALPAISHPLDGLSPTEISAVVTILKDDGKVDADSRYPLIELKEPEKLKVLAWKEGEPEDRQAVVNVKTKEGVFKGLVDISNKKVLSWEAVTGQPMLLLEEFLGAMSLALGNPEFVAGLEKRGLKPDQVFCLPLTAGAFGTPDEAGKRLMKVPCYVNPTQSNFYAKPIEGLFATVDLAGQKVVEVVDTGVVPVPEDGWGYGQEEIGQRKDMVLAPAMKEAKLSQPGGANVSIDGSLINWDMWSFRWRVDKRPGVVLSEITANDGKGPRSVLYQANLSEVFVPYMDPTEGWYWRTYMDSGEYGFGIFLSPLTAGVDCPAYAKFLPATVHADDGSPVEIPNAICVFERNIGDPAWRHYEIFAQTPEAPVPAEGRPATELVVRSASEVGNYDYLLDYVFQQNGMIRVMIGATGLDAVKGVASQSMKDPTAAEDTKYGTLIAPNLVAPNHDHFFNFRFDFDIDGQKNMFARTGLVAATAPEGTPRRTFWETKDEMPMTELQGRYKVNPATPAMYHVMNMGKETKLGHHPGYMILPENSVAYSPLDVVNDPPARRNAYIEYTFWNTPYDPEQRYAGGEYAFQSDGKDSLPEWVKQDRNIHDTDIVTWYTMGFHHVPHMEDWPVMSTMWKGITLMPYNFFDHNPSITIRNPS